MPGRYVRRLPPTWWLRRRSYFLFMMRELTAVFVGGYCVFLLAALWRIRAHGAGGFDEIVDLLQTPWSIAIHFFALLFTIYHSVTWFGLLPQAMPVRLGEERLPAPALVLPNYVLWLVLSALLVWLVLR